MQDHPRAPTPSQAWVALAGVLLGCAGVANCIIGIAAVLGSEVVGTGADALLTGDVNAPGSSLVLLGLLQGAASLLIWIGKRSGQWFGVFVGGLGLVGSLGIVDAHPVWAAILVAVDIAIIYGLAEHGAGGGLIE